MSEIERRLSKIQDRLDEINRLIRDAQLDFAEKTDHLTDEFAKLLEERQGLNQQIANMVDG